MFHIFACKISGLYGNNISLSVKGLKLEELAEQKGISKSALGSYEKDGYKEINHGNLILLADFYGVSLDYLFCRTENRAEINTPLRELHLSDEMVALLKSGRINNRLLCELATHKDFIKFLAKEFLQPDKLSELAKIIRSERASNLSEAIAVYKTQKTG